MKIDLNTSLKNNIHENSLTKIMNYPIPIYSTEEDNDEYDLSELTKSNILVDFTEDQFNNLYRFINVNRHRNDYLLEILNVLKRSKEESNNAS